MKYSRKYSFHEDSSHAWIAVPRAEVEASEAAITGYSYYDPATDTVYLEEDVDAPRFFRCAGINPFDLRFRHRGPLPNGLPFYRDFSP